MNPFVTRATQVDEIVQRVCAAPAPVLSVMGVRGSPETFPACEELLGGIEDRCVFFRVWRVKELQDALGDQSRSLANPLDRKSVV